MWMHLAKSNIVSSRPMCLLQLVLIPDGESDAIATFYSGRNENAPLLGAFRTGKLNTRHIPFDCGIQLENGLYVELGVGAQGVLVVWERGHGPDDVHE